MNNGAVLMFCLYVSCEIYVQISNCLFGFIARVSFVHFSYCMHINLNRVLIHRGMFGTAPPQCTVLMVCVCVHLLAVIKYMLWRVRIYIWLLHLFFAFSARVHVQCSIFASPSLAFPPVCKHAHTCSLSLSFSLTDTDAHAYASTQTHSSYSGLFCAVYTTPSIYTKWFRNNKIFVCLKFHVFFSSVSQFNLFTFIKGINKACSQVFFSCFILSIIRNRLYVYVWSQCRRRRCRQPRLKTKCWHGWRT